ncbi:NUDIX hydrolase [Psychrobacter aquaticus]|uniref:Putative nudix hydrolase YeaB n=1 Tax=Psychrobacter aquaticus CMS 56 TaxID=1354303 RepID=U4T3V2_9GAMM|nr:CoA pyrophosphatase [Psychrobacter aquaticus]ERL55987.1 putative nudix hydrolase YeaB [Psychrobacter aquaticus CMS 56]
MLLPPQSISFDEFSVAVPTFIRYPTLRKLAEQVQHETLNAITSPALYDTDHTSRSARILDSLYQTPIADASVLVAITHERHPKLLLTRRAAHMNSHAGEVSCVGGKYDISDGNNVITALREACEETALPPNKVQLLGQLPIQMSKSGMSVRPIVALIAPDLILVPELGEISRIFWADFESLLTQPTVEYEVEYTMQDQTATLLTPSWQVDGETVWGLTGRVIASLLETGFDRQLEWYYRIQNTRL